MSIMRCYRKRDFEHFKYIDLENSQRDCGIEMTHKMIEGLFNGRQVEFRPGGFVLALSPEGKSKGVIVENGPSKGVAMSREDFDKEYGTVYGDFIDD